jgi:hypothetical protein
MSYIVNTNSFAENFVPPKKRSADIVAWAKTLVFPLQVLYDTMFGTYKDGITVSDWDVATTYYIGDQVKYIDKSIYQCYRLNTGNAPTNENFWFKIQDKFVGIEPRMKYNSQHLVLEWALNEWFGTTFVNTPGASDIFISAISVFDTTFWVGATESESSLVTYDNTDTFGWIQAQDLTAIDYTFSINVPLAVWTALDTVVGNRDKIIMAFADTYVLAGVKYNIITY